MRNTVKLKVAEILARLRNPKSGLLLSLLLVATFIVGLSAGLLARSTPALYVNGHPSHLTLQSAGNVQLVPLSLPVDPTVAEWTVQIDRDDAKNRVDVQLSHKTKQRRRGDNPCTACQSTGKCPYDYPAGSGNTTSGNPCYSCTATGKCNYCKGEGKW